MEPEKAFSIVFIVALLAAILTFAGCGTNHGTDQLYKMVVIAE